MSDLGCDTGTEGSPAFQELEDQREPLVPRRCRPELVSQSYGMAAPHCCQWGHGVAQELPVFEHGGREDGGQADLQYLAGARGRYAQRLGTETDDGVAGNRFPSAVVGEPIVTEVEQERDRRVRDHRDIDRGSVAITEARHPGSRDPGPARHEDVHLAPVQSVDRRHSFRLARSRFLAICTRGVTFVQDATAHPRHAGGMTELNTAQMHSSQTVRGLHTVADGDSAKPPILLIHGSGATGSSWGPVVPALTTEYRVIRVDLPGCGRSEPAPTYAVPRQADRVAAVLDELGLRDLRVVGHSSGGYVATALVEQRPDLVSSLVLVSSGPSPAALLPQPAVLRLLSGRPLGPLIWRVRTTAMIRAGLAATAARPVEVPDGVVADLRRTSYSDFRSILDANSAYIAARTVPERLATTGKPLLVIFGDSDPRWDPASAHQYEAVPGAKVEYLAGVGHVAMLEAGAALARLILAGTQSMP